MMYRYNSFYAQAACKVRPLLRQKGHTRTDIIEYSIGGGDMVIYADILVAVNYFVSYALLCGIQRIAGIPITRRRKVAASLVGGLCALAVFLPLSGFFYGIVLRVLTAAAMLAVAWPGRSVGEYLRLGTILFGISILFAGGVMALCLFWPSLPVSCPGGVVYFNISPLLLLAAVTGSYLLLGLLRRFYGRGRCSQLICKATIVRQGKEVTLNLLKDSGNRLVEPFSGLPVAVCTLQGVAPLLSAEECKAVLSTAEPEEIPPGFRLVAFQAVGGRGLLAAFRPDSVIICCGQRQYDCLAWVAVKPDKMPECDGVFNPDMLELRI